MLEIKNLKYDSEPFPDLILHLLVRLRTRTAKLLLEHRNQVCADSTGNSSEATRIGWIIENIENLLISIFYTLQRRGSTFLVRCHYRLLSASEDSFLRIAMISLNKIEQQAPLDNCLLIIMSRHVTVSDAESLERTNLSSRSFAMQVRPTLTKCNKSSIYTKIINKKLKEKSYLGYITWVNI